MFWTNIIEMRAVKHGFKVISLKINHMDLGNIIILIVKDIVGYHVKRYD